MKGHEKVAPVELVWILSLAQKAPQQGGCLHRTLTEVVWFKGSLFNHLATLHPSPITERSCSISTVAITKAGAGQTTSQQTASS